MSHRKLQQEVDKVFKKIGEGLETFDSLYERHEQCTNNQSQRDKLESDLKREIKKLQRLRDQIKVWQSSPDIKDKQILLPWRRKVENAMEEYKIVEKGSKEKAFSNISLKRSEVLDPHQQAIKDESDFISNAIEEFDRQFDLSQVEIDKVATLQRKRKNPSKSNEEKMKKLLNLQMKYRWHQEKLEIALRLLANEELSPDLVSSLEEDIQYYLDNNQDDPEAFIEDDSIYEPLHLDCNEFIAAEVAASFKAQHGSKLLEDAEKEELYQQEQKQRQLEDEQNLLNSKTNGNGVNGTESGSKSDHSAVPSQRNPLDPSKLSKKEQRKLLKDQKQAAKAAAKAAAAAAQSSMQITITEKSARNFQPVDISDSGKSDTNGKVSEMAEEDQENDQHSREERARANKKLSELPISRTPSSATPTTLSASLSTSELAQKDTPVLNSSSSSLNNSFLPHIKAPAVNSRSSSIPLNNNPSRSMSPEPTLQNHQQHQHITTLNGLTTTSTFKPAVTKPANPIAWSTLATKQHMQQQNQIQNPVQQQNPQQLNIQPILQPQQTIQAPLTPLTPQTQVKAEINWGKLAATKAKDTVQASSSHTTPATTVASLAGLPQQPATITTTTYSSPRLSHNNLVTSTTKVETTSTLNTSVVAPPPGMAPLSGVTGPSISTPANQHAQLNVSDNQSLPNNTNDADAEPNMANLINHNLNVQTQKLQQQQQQQQPTLMQKTPSINGVPAQLFEPQLSENSILHGQSNEEMVFDDYVSECSEDELSVDEEIFSEHDALTKSGSIQSNNSQKDIAFLQKTQQVVANVFDDKTDYSLVALPSGLQDFVMSCISVDNSLIPSSKLQIRTGTQMCKPTRLPLGIPRNVVPPQQPNDIVRNMQQWDHARYNLELLNGGIHSADSFQDEIISRFQNLDDFTLFYGFYFGLTPQEQSISEAVLKQKGWIPKWTRDQWCLKIGETKYEDQNCEIASYRVFKSEDWSCVDKANFKFEYAVMSLS